jgi:hypothetical protein
LLGAACAGRAETAVRPAAPAEEEAPLTEGHLWFQEPRRGGPLWRGGHGRLTADRLTWKSPADSRPALLLSTADIVAVRPLDGPGPAGHGSVLELRTAGGEEVRLAADDRADWLRRVDCARPTADAG